MAAALGGCSALRSQSPPADPVEAAEQADFMMRLAERLASTQREERSALLFRLERLMPAWQNEQRDHTEGPLEAVLVQDVVAHVDILLETLRHGTDDRRLVAAWALGFSRVPENDLGIRSPHPEAVEALVEAIGTADDALMRNVMLALWKIGDETTPLQPVVDVATRHHDAESRANATLALGTILDERRNERAVDAVLAALRDQDARVRLHAATVARRHPHPAYTSRIKSLLGQETTPLVRASMAAALGHSGDVDSAKLLLGMLTSSHRVEAVSARSALANLYGEDFGPRPQDWPAAPPR